jgi:predicted dehydrogenase
MKEKLNVSIIGIANHGVTIRNAALKCEKINIVSAYDINTDELNKFASQANCKAANDYDEIVNDNAIDAVILVTPNHLHLDQCKKAVDKKKHIFLEKPITNFVNEGIELVNYVNKGGVTLQVGHHMRYRLHCREIKKLVEQGKIGEIVSFYCNFFFFFGFNPNIPKWKMDKKTCPLLPMMQLGVHFIDTIQYMIDDVEKISCMAVSHSMGNGIIDNTVANIKLKGNVVGVLNCHYIIPAIFEIKIFGTKGTIYLNGYDLEVEYVNSGKRTKERKSIDETKYNAYDIEIADFADKILKNESPEIDGIMGIKNLASIEAMNISVEQGREVRIDEVFNPSLII